MLTVTISRMDGQLLRVNILPKRKTDKESAAEDALSTPLTVTATAAELDQDFAGQVLSFSRSYQRSAANIREIEDAHAAAVKAAEEERKAMKPATLPAKTSPRSDNDSKPAPGEKPVFGSKGQSAPAPATQSLCETPAGEAKGEQKCAITSPVASAPGIAETGSAAHPVKENICDICKYPILPSWLGAASSHAGCSSRVRNGL